MIFWREAVIAALVALLAWTGHIYLSQRDETKACETTYQNAVDAAKAQRDEVTARSEEAVRKLRINHDKKLAEAVSNARINWGAISLHSQPAVPDATSVADRACPSDEAVGQLVVDCATDANTIGEFQRWIRLNRFPIADE